MCTASRIRYVSLHVQCTFEIAKLITQHAHASCVAARSVLHESPSASYFTTVYFTTIGSPNRALSPQAARGSYFCCPPTFSTALRARLTVEVRGHCRAELVRLGALAHERHPHDRHAERRRDRDLRGVVRLEVLCEGWQVGVSSRVQGVWVGNARRGSVRRVGGRVETQAARLRVAEWCRADQGCGWWSRSA